jgi:hypothetical protein
MGESETSKGFARFAPNFAPIPEPECKHQRPRPSLLLESFCDVSTPSRECTIEPICDALPTPGILGQGQNPIGFDQTSARGDTASRHMMFSIDCARIARGAQQRHPKPDANEGTGPEQVVGSQGCRFTTMVFARVQSEMQTPGEERSPVGRPNGDKLDFVTEAPRAA